MSEFPFLSKELKAEFQGNICTPMFKAALFLIANMKLIQVPIDDE